MKFNKSAWKTFQNGTSSEKLKRAAKSKTDGFFLWLAVSLGAFYFLGWEWALLPAVLAAVNGVQGLDASKLAPEIEALENMLQKNYRS